VISELFKRRSTYRYAAAYIPWLEEIFSLPRLEGKRMPKEVWQSQLLGYLNSNDALSRMIEATRQGRAALEGVIETVERFMNGHELSPSFNVWIGKVIAKTLRNRGFATSGRSLCVRGSKYFTEAAVFVRL
jgi:hypothetical protein